MFVKLQFLFTKRIAAFFSFQLLLFCFALHMWVVEIQCKATVVTSYPVAYQRI